MTFYPSTREVEAGRLEAQGHPGYKRSCLKISKTDKCVDFCICLDTNLGSVGDWLWGLPAWVISLVSLGFFQQGRTELRFDVRREVTAHSRCSLLPGMPLLSSDMQPQVLPCGSYGPEWEPGILWKLRARG